MSNTVFSKYNDALDRAASDKKNKIADLLIGLGLVLSSFFTVVYMVLAFGGALLGLGWAALGAYGLGALLGVAAVVPGELALFVWRVKLQSDPDINGLQIGIAWFAGLAGAISAAVSTVSFFAYVLSGLMPAWYDPAVANGVNIVNVAASWAVFGISMFVYAGASSRAAQNRERARAAGLIKAGQNKMMIGIAGGIQDQIIQTVAAMAERGAFSPDAVNMIAGEMGLDGDRLAAVKRLAGGNNGGGSASPPAKNDRPAALRQPPAKNNGVHVENF
jgi:hypothetical protein